MLFTKHIVAIPLLYLAALAVAPLARAAPDSHEVLVYPTREEGSIMHWLAVAPLPYDAAYIGDSMNYDVFKQAGGSELTVRPHAGDLEVGHAWRKMHWTGTTEGPTMCSLFDIAGGFDYGITACFAYIYSPDDHPNALFYGSSDDGLKVVLNDKKVWANQIQRSPTYDSDQFAAPLHKGWNTLLCVVDQVIGGHLLCARFLDNGQPLTDLQISLDPPTDDAARHPAADYNQAASELIRNADALRADGKPDEAIAAYQQVIEKYPLADIAARAIYSTANCYYSATGEKSLGDAAHAQATLQSLLDRYPQDLLAEYAQLDIGKLQADALHNDEAAIASYQSFEDRFPLSSLDAASQVALARLLAQQKKFEDAILIYRKVIKKYPKDDQVMTATVGIGDAYLQAGQKEKARQQYTEARAMATDWHDNKYGIDVGKQAWLTGILDYLRQQLAS